MTHPIPALVLAALLGVGPAPHATAPEKLKRKEAIQLVIEQSRQIQALESANRQLRQKVSALDRELQELEQRNASLTGVSAAWEASAKRLQKRVKSLENQKNQPTVAQSTPAQADSQPAANAEKADPYDSGFWDGYQVGAYDARQGRERRGVWAKQNGERLSFPGSPYARGYHRGYNEGWLANE